jgi:hypothetical protein
MRPLLPMRRALRASQGIAALSTWTSPPGSPSEQGSSGFLRPRARSLRCFAAEERVTHHPQRVAVEQLVVYQRKLALNQLLRLSA